MPQWLSPAEYHLGKLINLKRWRSRVQIPLGAIDKNINLVNNLNLL
tara:strand:+ start:35111 stop:35248 length:138 start_codon:yes stop_codon:yes gene_type:complete